MCSKTVSHKMRARRRVHIYLLSSEYLLLTDGRELASHQILGDVKIINLPCVESSFPFILSISLGFQPFKGVFELAQHPSNALNLTSFVESGTTGNYTVRCFALVFFICQKFGRGTGPLFPLPDPPE